LYDWFRRSIDYNTRHIAPASYPAVRHPPTANRPEFSPTKTPALPGKTPHTTNRGHFAVTYLNWDRLIGVIEKIEKIKQQHSKY
jgi:hypothetical protein